MDSLDLRDILSQAVSLNAPFQTSLSKGSPDRDTPLPVTGGKVSAQKAEKKTAKKAHKKKRSWKKPKGKPKRPLSAYNIFFARERENIILSTPAPPPNPDGPKRRQRRDRVVHGKIGFADLAKRIGAKWKTMDAAARKEFDALAAVERQRYERELEAWNSKEVVISETEPVISEIAQVASASSNIDHAVTNDVNFVAAAEKLRYEMELQAWSNMNNSGVPSVGMTANFPPNTKSFHPDSAPSSHPFPVIGKGFVSEVNNRNLGPTKIESHSKTNDTLNTDFWLGAAPAPSLFNDCVGSGFDEMKLLAPRTSTFALSSHTQQQRNNFSSSFMIMTEPIIEPLAAESEAGNTTGISDDLKDFMSQLESGW